MRGFLRLVALLGFSALLSGQDGCIVIDCDVSGCVQDCRGCDCSSCGCSDCAACGLVPIPRAYDSDVVQNAMQLRLTESGLDFIETHAHDVIQGAGGLLGIDPTYYPLEPIDMVQNITDPIFGNVIGAVRIVGCPLALDPDSGEMIPSCYAKLSFRELELNPEEGTNTLRVHVNVEIETVNAAGRLSPIPVTLSGWVAGQCNVTLGRGPDGFPRPTTFDYEVDVVMETIPAGQAREGFTKLRFIDVGFVGGAAAGGLQTNTIDAALCPLANIINYPATIASSGNASVRSFVNQLDTMFACHQVYSVDACPNMPDGSPTTPVDLGLGTAWTCTDQVTGQCVPMLAGLESRIEFGGLLSSISPGTGGMVDMIMASAGDAHAEANGLSLDFLSGVSPAPLDDCVPHGGQLPAPPTPPESIGLFHTDLDPDGSTDHHVALGISESYLNYFLDRAWRGGGFCISLGTNVTPILSTGLLSIVVPDLTTLAFPQSQAPVYIAVRPKNPSALALGEGTIDDPLIQVSMAGLELDFYVWSSERFVRFLTIQTDFELGLNMEVDEMGDVNAHLAYMNMLNPVGSNGELLTGDPQVIAAGVADIVAGGALDLILPEGGIPAFSIPDTGDLTIDVDLRRAEDEGEAFLGAFVTLGGSFTGMPLTRRADTRVEVTRVDIPDASTFDVETLGQGEAPGVEIALGGEGFDGVEYEFSYRVDGNDWSPWRRSRYARLESRSLLLQGRHGVEARARVVGMRGTSDLSPARDEFVIDVLPPSLEVVSRPEGTEVRVDDIVSPPEEIQYRWREVGSSYGAWANLGEHEMSIDDASGWPGAIEVEVRDAAGNVASNAAELRGLPEDGAGGCGGCSSSGEPISSKAWLLLVMLGLLGCGRRRAESRRA